MRLLFQVFFFSLLCFCFTNVLQGQQPVMRQYTAEDGLPGGMVYVTIQDQQGYIWIGTDRGIVRFDGNHFKIFTVKDGLPSNEVWGISEDKTGKLWLDTFNGICYIKGETVHNLKGELFPKRKGRVTHLLTAVGHYIQFDNDNLFYFPEGGKPQKVSDKSKGRFYLPSDHIITDKLIEDSLLQKISANLDLASNQELLIVKESVVVDTDERFYTKFDELYARSEGNPLHRRYIEVESISKNEILFLIDGQVWRLNNNGFSKEKIDHLIEKEEKTITVNWIKKLAPNLIWLKTTKGNFIVDSLLQVYPEYDFLIDIQTNNIFIDKQKNLWLSSYNGLLFISRKVQSSRSYTINSKKQSNSFNFLAVNKKTTSGV